MPPQGPDRKAMPDIRRRCVVPPISRQRYPVRDHPPPPRLVAPSLGGRFPPRGAVVGFGGIVVELPSIAGPPLA